MPIFKLKNTIPLNKDRENNMARAKRSKLENTRIHRSLELIAPVKLKKRLPPTPKTIETVLNARKEIKEILEGKSGKKILVVGPCSIHDPEEALEYADKLKKLQEHVKDKFLLVMRAYFEKPRTTTGWQGGINDPDLDGSLDIQKGLPIARKLLIDIAEKGVPVGTEALDHNIPQYLGDLHSWAAIGARTSESQTHRNMASGLSMPVGIKNGTVGDVETAINGMIAARQPSAFLGISEAGRSAVLKTKGNPDVHVILRGGLNKTNFDSVSVKETIDKMEKAGLPPTIMIDCSHANSQKNHNRQPHVFEDVINQIIGGNKHIIGAMIESNLNPGNQKFSPEPGAKEKLMHGVSITDACIDWETTEKIIRQAHQRLVEADKKE